MSDCIFCKIASGDISADIIWQDENAVAFRDINPRAPVHALIIPREHIVTLGEMTEANAPFLVSMAKGAKAVAEIEGVLESGYRVLANNGPDAHQEVMHFHLHVFGGRELGSMLKKFKD